MSFSPSWNFHDLVEVWHRHTAVETEKSAHIGILLIAKDLLGGYAARV